MCWKSHDLITFVACLGRTPRLSGVEVEVKLEVTSGELEDEAGEDFPENRPSS